MHLDGDAIRVQVCAALPTRAFSSHERAVRQGLHPMTRNLPQRRQRPPVREPDGFSGWSTARNSSPAPQNPRWSGNERALAWPRPRGTSRPGPSQSVIVGASKSQSFRTPVRAAGRAGNNAMARPRWHGPDGTAHKYIAPPAPGVNVARYLRVDVPVIAAEKGRAWLGPPAIHLSFTLGD